MRNGRPRICERLLAGFRREDGVSSVEAVLWMPFFLLLFSMVVDVSLVLGAQADVLRLVQDTNRAVSIGRYQDIEDARTYIRTEVAQISPTATVTLDVDESGVITAIVIMPTRDLTATGLFDGLANIDIVVRAQQLSEA